MLSTLTRSVSRGFMATGYRSFSVCSVPGSSVFSWGSGDDGQLGQPTIEKSGVMNKYNQLSPLAIPGLQDIGITYVSAGATHSAAVTSDGILLTFGSSSHGALGHTAGDEGSTMIPAQVEGLPTNVVQAECGEKHTAALTADGDVYTWGSGGSFFGGAGALGLGDTTSYDRPQKVSLGENEVKIKAIASGQAHMVALGVDGEVWTWGMGEGGRLGNGDNSDQYSPHPVELLLDLDLDIKQIAAGSKFSMAITSEGDLYAWGMNDQGQLGVGAGLSMDMYSMEPYPTQISLPEGEKVKYVATGEGHTSVVTEDGGVYIWGLKTWLEPQKMTALEEHNVIQVACGNSVSAAVTDTGDVLTWGKGMAMRRSGVLGQGDKKSHLQPQLVDGFDSSIQFVSLGQKHALAISGKPEV